MGAYVSETAGRAGTAIHRAACRALDVPKRRVWIDYDGTTGFRVEVYACLGSIPSDRIEALLLWLEGHVWKWQLCQNRVTKTPEGPARWRRPVVFSRQREGV